VYWLHIFHKELNAINMGRVERGREIARRRARRSKLKKLRARFAVAKTESEKAALLEKAFRVSPLATLE
jgi:hypothetical protein